MQAGGHLLLRQGVTHASQAMPHAKAWTAPAEHARLSRVQGRQSYAMPVLLYVPFHQRYGDRHLKLRKRKTDRSLRMIEAEDRDEKVLD